MKLLFCKSCEDIFKLDRLERSCRCGAVKGQVLEDGLNAIYQGDQAVPVGIHNPSFALAICNQPETGLGESFMAFVVPKQCRTMRKQ